MRRSPGWMFDGGAKTKAGVTITEHNADTIPTVLACVRVISEDVAKLPMKFFENLPDDSKSIVRDHPLWNIFNVRANPHSPSINFREVVTANVMLWGNGYAEIEFNNAGDPINLLHMKPERVVPYWKGDQLFYEYTNEDGRPVDLPEWRVLHVRGLGCDGIVGSSVIRKIRESLGLAKAAEEFGAQFFGDGAKPIGVLETPLRLSPTGHKNLQDSFEAKYKKSDTAARPLILEEGTKWNGMTMPLEDAQFLETRKFQVEEIARIFRVPPHMVGDHSNATFSNIEHVSKTYVDTSLTGYFVRWEQEILFKLIAPRWKRMGASHNAAALLRGDLKSRYEAYGIGRQWGFRTVNGILRLEDENTIGPEGDQTIVPVNMTTPQKLEQMTPGAAAAAGAASAPAPDPKTRSLEPSERRQQLAKTFTPLLRDALARILRVEKDKVQRSVKKGETSFAGLYASHGDHVRGVVFPIVEAIGVFAGVPGEWVPKTVAAISERHLAMSLSDVAAGGALESRLKNWDEARPDKDTAAILAIVGQELFP
ncbi:MAG: phage portal protein [Phycisphaerales bacterium]